MHEASRCLDGLAKLTARSAHASGGSSSVNSSSSVSVSSAGALEECVWTGRLPPPSARGGAGEHARGAVAALLARLAALTDAVAAMQAAR